MVSHLALNAKIKTSILYFSQILLKNCLNIDLAREEKLKLIIQTR